MSDHERYARLKQHLLVDHHYGEDYFALVEDEEPLTLGNLRWLHEPYGGHGCPTTRQIEEGVNGE